MTELLNDESNADNLQGDRRRDSMHLMMQHRGILLLFLIGLSDSALVRTRRLYIRIVTRRSATYSAEARLLVRFYSLLYREISCAASACAFSAFARRRALA